MAEYIERDALLADISNAVDHGGMGRVVGQTLMRYAKRIPAADVAPVVHGRWEPCFDDDGNWRRGYARCSNCGREYYASVIRHYECCRKCGAKMDGGDAT